MIKSILILILLLISIDFSIAEEEETEDDGFKLISSDDNAHRAAHCGYLRYRTDTKKSRVTQARDAPWLVKTYSKEKPELYTHGMLISPRHVLTDVTLLMEHEHYKDIYKMACDNGLVDMTSLDFENGDFKVELEVCKEDSEDCKTVADSVVDIVHMQIIGDCNNSDSFFLLVEIGIDVDSRTVCLPKNGVSLDVVYAQKIVEGVIVTLKTQIQLCFKDKERVPHLCTKNTFDDFKNMLGVPMITSRDGRVYFEAIGKHKQDSSISRIGPFESIMDMHQKLICELTGVCPISTTTPSGAVAIPPASESTTTLPATSSESPTSSRSIQALSKSGRPSVTTESPENYTGTFRPHPDWHMNRAPRKRIEFKIHLPLDPIPSEFDYEQEKLLEEEYDALDGIKKKKKKKTAGKRNFMGILLVLLVFWELFE